MNEDSACRCNGRRPPSATFATRVAERSADTPLAIAVAHATKAINIFYGRK